MTVTSYQIKVSQMATVKPLYTIFSVSGSLGFQAPFHNAYLKVEYVSMMRRLPGSPNADILTAEISEYDIILNTANCVMRGDEQFLG